MRAQTSNLRQLSDSLADAFAERAARDEKSYLHEPPRVPLMFARAALTFVAGLVAMLLLDTDGIWGGLAAAFVVGMLAVASASAVRRARAYRSGWLAACEAIRREESRSSSMAEADSRF